MTDPKVTPEVSNPQTCYRIKVEDLKFNAAKLNDLYMNRMSDNNGIFLMQEKVNKIFKRACSNGNDVDNYRHLTAFKAFLDPIAEGAKSLRPKEQSVFLDYILDFNGDGKVDEGDIEGFDTNDDGKIDIKGFDKNGDGFIDEKEVGDYAKYLINTINPKVSYNGAAAIDKSIKANSIFNKRGELVLDAVQKE